MVRLSALRLPSFKGGIGKGFRGNSLAKLGRTGAPRERISFFVIAGLDPAIHAEWRLAKDAEMFSTLHFSMDHRVKPGGDE